MAQVVVRQLEERVKEGLKRRARQNGRSMEDEVRHILREAVRQQPRAHTTLGSRIAARFAGQGLAQELPELRGQNVRPATFKP